MSTVNISQVDFGKNDGKNEAEKENFFELFYDDNNHYNKLTNENYFLITGQKGAGKTLLANYFAKNKEMNKNCQVCALYAVDFIEEKLLTFSRSNIAKEELTLFWKYVYLRNIGKMICERVNSSAFYKLKWIRKSKVKRLESLLKDIQLIVDSAEMYSSSEESQNAGVAFDVSAVNGSMKGKANANEGAKYVDSQTAQMKKKEYFELISELELEVTKNINPKEEFYVIYDDLDQLEEQMEISNFLELMKSMIYAADNLNAKFRAKKVNARIIHVVRSDIKEMLYDDSNNIQKVFSDFGVHIDWFSRRQDNPHHHPIMKMLLHKIKSSNIDYKTLSNKELYSLYFKEDEPILDFLLNNSFGRPREIVQFLLLYQEMFPNAKKINMSNLSECLPSYSEWLYGAVLSEIKIVKESDEVKAVLALIKERGHKGFTFKKLLEFMDNNSKIKVRNLLETLQLMYKLGLVGTRNKNGTIEFYFRTNVNSLPKDYTKFIVHFGLLKHLNLN